jgi:hypothetical protein
MIKSWAKPDFIPSYQEMKLTINSYLSDSHRKAPEDVMSDAARVFFAHCSGLVANRRYDIVRSFYAYALRRHPALFLKPPNMMRALLHWSPWIGPMVCQRFSKNAGLQ